MPYIKPREPDYIKVKRIIAGYGINAPRLAEMIEVTPPTARKRLAEPEQFTLADLKKISQRGHIPFEELRDAIQW